MQDDSEDAGLTSGGTPLNCTANDIDIASATVTAYSFDDVTYTPLPPGEAIQCNEGQTIFAETEALLQNNAQERYDIGVWIATDGGDALTGSCLHFNLVLEEAGVADLDGGDTCGDMAAGGLTTVKLDTLQLVCNANENGFVEVGACVGWQNQLNGPERVCADPGSPQDFRFKTTPDTKSKCNCEPFELPIIVNQTAKLEVVKACVPAAIPGATFDLLIDGVVEATDAACGGTTGAQTVSAGTNEDPGDDHTFAESGFTAADYTTSYACVNRVGGGDRGSGTSLGPNNITLQPDDDVICTFTNTKQASLKIIKDAVPNSATDFDFDATGAGLPADIDLDDDADPGLPNFALFSQLTPGGTRTVTETASATHTLTGIACTGATTSTVQIGADADFDAGDAGVTVGLAAGEDVVCTFTNTANGSITIVKDAAPNDAQDFDFDATGAGVPADIDLDDDADPGLPSSETFSNLAPGSRTFTETAVTGWDLTNIQCTGQTSSTVVIGAAGGFNAGDLSATVGLAAGENVTCTFTNSRRPRLIVQKVVVGGGTQSFDFTRNPGGVAFSLLNGGENNSGFTLAPGVYTVCELDLAVTWTATATIDGAPATLVNPDLPEDHGNRCVSVTLAYGDSKTVVWTNNAPPPPGGDARTIGYWKNWSSCTGGRQYIKAQASGELDKTLDFYLPTGSAIYPIGDLTGTPALSCAQAVNLLNKRPINSTKKAASDPAYNLAAQFLAARLNYAAGATQCAAATTAIASAQTLLDAINFNGTGSYKNMGASNVTLANQLAATLDSYNNNTLCPVVP
ncbi:MAG TPA: hypothetical protein VFT04_05030 [Gemmatimonadales bacterium]|nr:hypothetical protein [Gemmatimonadales bacterium]